MQIRDHQHQSHSGVRLARLRTCAERYIILGFAFSTRHTADRRSVRSAADVPAANVAWLPLHSSAPPPPPRSRFVIRIVSRWLTVRERRRDFKLARHLRCCCGRCCCLRRFCVCVGIVILHCECACVLVPPIGRSCCSGFSTRNICSRMECA